MRFQKWNGEWEFSKGMKKPIQALIMGKNTGNFVNIPHDAMIHESRSKTALGGHQTGFYPGGSYSYTKKLFAPDDWKSKVIVLELEGVYNNARVYINGDFAGGYPNGYSNFYVKLDNYLRFGVENEIKVLANNCSEPNSRWYSGSGIYRNVNLITSELIHIDLNGVKITPREIEEDQAIVVVDVALVNEGREKRDTYIITTITDADGKEVACDKSKWTAFPNSMASIRQRIRVENPLLWDCENPHLYTSTTKIVAEDELIDQEMITFGIRSLQMDTKRGLRINGKETKIRGACIHHDNGVIGACTLDKAEERRCRQLKEAGFNCLRSSHHPMSKAMLDACDRFGMLVMDELTDVWNIPKNVGDYSLEFLEHWEKDIELMIEKDYNHPCVIMYCTGNEIPETQAARGSEMAHRISEKFKSLDDTRYTISAINGLQVIGVRADEVLKDITGYGLLDFIKHSIGTSDEGGSHTLNSAMSVLGGELADKWTTHPIMTEMLEEFTACTDISGFNYITGRHEMELDLYPHRTVLGTETFPSDIARLWGIVKRNPHVLGDCTWTGYDYLGEAGIGIFYYDNDKSFGRDMESSISYIGDIDITGYRRPISYLREIVFGLRKEPYLAVRRLNRHGMPCSKTLWAIEDNIASWTWSGYQGKPAIVDVYSDADEVELLLNGKSLGRKPAGEGSGFVATFELEYAPGKLETVGYRNGIAAERNQLLTASDKVNMKIDADKENLLSDGEDLAFVTIMLEDADGVTNLNAIREITVSIEGPGEIQGFGTADPQTTNHYDCRSWNTYDGRALAVIRAGRELGELRLTISDNMSNKKVLTFTVK